MNKKLVTLSTTLLVALIAITGISAKAFADNEGLRLGVKANADIKMMNNDENDGNDNENMNSVFGTVTAINGTTVTVQTKTFTKGSTTSTATTYTVNASGATVDKNKVASTVSAIAVGDNVMVQGAISGTTVIATSIHDGIMVKMPKTPKVGTQTPQGNGQPVIGGKVTVISGNIVTITNNSNTAYTIDVTNAKITKAGSTITVSSIALGDQVLAQGTINGTSVIATTLIDGVPGNGNGKHLGWFKQIGGFFSHIFGSKK